MEWSTIRPVIDLIMQGIIDAGKLAADNDLTLRISNRLIQYNADLVDRKATMQGFSDELDVVL